MTSMRNMVPGDLALPLATVPAVTWINLEVADDGTVSAPGLEEVAPVLMDGGAEVVRQVCAQWTAWLERVESGVRT